MGTCTTNVWAEFYKQVPRGGRAVLRAASSLFPTRGVSCRCVRDVAIILHPVNGSKSSPSDKKHGWQSSRDTRRLFVLNNNSRSGFLWSSPKLAGDGLNVTIDSPGNVTRSIKADLSVRGNNVQRGWSVRVECLLLGLFDVSGKFLCIRSSGNCLERNVWDFWAKYAVEWIEIQKGLKIKLKIKYGRRVVSLEFKFEFK